MSALTEWKSSIEDRIEDLERLLLELTTSVQDSIREGEVHVHDVKQQHANHESRILGIGAAVRVLEEFARHFDIEIVKEMANNAQERARQDLTDRRLLRIEDALGKGIIEPDPELKLVEDLIIPASGRMVLNNVVTDVKAGDTITFLWNDGTASGLVVSPPAAEGNQHEGGHVEDMAAKANPKVVEIANHINKEHANLWKNLKEGEAAHEWCEEKLYDATTSRDAWKQKCKNTEVLYEERIRRYNQLETDLAHCSQVAERYKEDAEKYNTMYAGMWEQRNRDAALGAMVRRMPERMSLLKMPVAPGWGVNTEPRCYGATPEEALKAALEDKTE